MRKIVAGLMASVDGVVEAPETWTGPYFSPELGQHVGSLDLLVFPVVAGQGKRLFGSDGDRAALALAGCEAFPSGVAHLTYRPPQHLRRGGHHGVPRRPPNRQHVTAKGTS